MKFQSAIRGLRLILLPEHKREVNGVVLTDGGVVIHFENGNFDVEAFVTRITAEKPELVNSPAKAKAFRDSVVDRIISCGDFLCGKVWEHKVLTAEQKADLMKAQFDAQFAALKGEDRDRFVKQFTINMPGVSVRHVDHDAVEVINHEADAEAEAKKAEAEAKSKK